MNFVLIISWLLLVKQFLLFSSQILFKMTPQSKFTKIATIKTWREKDTTQ